jgi:methylmalonyl-CoA mutase cobalamin-binding subunit
VTREEQYSRFLLYVLRFFILDLRFGGVAMGKAKEQAEDKPPEPGHKRRVMVGAIGKCVHNLGVEGFADWMEDQGLGYATVKLGPAVPIQEVINKIREARPEVVGVSMRLGDLHVDKLITEFVELATQYGLHPRESGIRYSFGGLRPAANLVRAMTGLPLEPDEFIREDEQHYDLEAVQEKYKDREDFQAFFDLVVDDFVTMEELEDFAQRKARFHRGKMTIWWSAFAKFGSAKVVPSSAPTSALRLRR